jgi:hypothetical protein
LCVPSSSTGETLLQHRQTLGVHPVTLPAPDMAKNPSQTKAGSPGDASGLRAMWRNKGQRIEGWRKPAWPMSMRRGKTYNTCQWSPVAFAAISAEPKLPVLLAGKPWKQHRPVAHAVADAINALNLLERQISVGRDEVEIK